MSRHELAMRNRALSEKRLRGRGPRGPFPSLTSSPRRARSRRKPERILALCPGGPEYALFSTPALYALRTVYPLARITAGVGLASEPILRHNREIDDLRVVPALDASLEQAGPRELDDWAEALDAEQYDVALVMAPAHWIAALLAARARIPRRLGIDDESGAGGFLTDRVPRDPDAHAVTHNLRLVEALVGAPPTVETRLRFWMSDTVVALAYRSALADLGDDTRTLVAISPGDGLRPADWRPEGWALVADQLILQHDANVALVGDGTDAGAARREAIARGMRFEPTLIDGPLDALFMAALFVRCGLVMGGHSGLIHLAVALERPTVLLYGPHDPAEVGPWADPVRHRVLRSPMPCAPCRLPDWPDDPLDDHPCVRDIDSFAVLDAALDLLAATPAHTTSAPRTVQRDG
jgi:heptosyltransferase-2/heptosyltransferase-3